MPSTFTTNCDIELQGTGENSGTWGSVLNLAAFTVIDTVLGGVQTLSLSSSNVTLSTTQGQNQTIKLTGTLTANVDVTFPAIGRTYYVVNSTTGAFDVTLKCAGGGDSFVIPQGSALYITLDATSVLVATLPGVPIGVFVPYAGTSAPSRWLFCYGQAISRTTYAALFAAIGTSFGSGDGSTTFNVPDLRGRVVAGKDNMGGSSADRLTSPLDGDVLAAAGGSQSHTLSTSEIPAHTHTVQWGTIDTDGGITSGGSTVGGTTTSSSTGGGGSHNNVQPTIIGNYIIYAGV